MGETNYHLKELEIALDPGHPAHILPPALPGDSVILDIGCGAGQTLMAAYPQHTTFGIDIDLTALKLGRTLTSRAQFVCGDAGRLPWRDDVFDAVVSRVALPYTDLSSSLPEIRRVLKPGGLLWVTLHPFSQLWDQAKESNWKGRVYFGYVMANSLLFHVTQRQFRFNGRFESFQTRRGIARALKQIGFESVLVADRPHFLVTARRC